MTTSNSATVQIFGIGSRLSARAAEAVSAFSDGLAGTVPASDTCNSMILADGNGLSAYKRISPDRWQPLFANAADNAGRLKQDMAKLPRGRVLLRAGEGRAVMTRLALPAATRDVLSQVVRNKVESLAPWPVSEVLWGYRAVNAPQSGQIMVDVGIISRKTATGLLEKFAAAGVKIARFEVGISDGTSSGIEIDVHGEERRQAMRGRVKLVMSILTGAALLVGGYGGYLSYQTAAEAAKLDEGIAKVQLLLRNKGDAGEVSEQLAAANVLHTRKLETRPAIELLNTVTVLVPDAIWLSTLEVDKSTLTIAGRGTQVPGVIETLESSEAFRDVNFASATQREADAATDSFSISAVIEAKASAP